MAIEKQYFVDHNVGKTLPLLRVPYPHPKNNKINKKWRKKHLTKVTRTTLVLTLDTLHSRSTNKESEPFSRIPRSLLFLSSLRLI